MYEFSVAVKFIEKKTMGFPSEYENSIILDSILKEDLSNDELQKKSYAFYPFLYANIKNGSIFFFNHLRNNFFLFFINIFFFFMSSSDKSE